MASWRVGAVLLAVCAAASGCNPLEPELWGKCDEAIKARLKSPDSYERVDARAIEVVLNETTLDYWGLQHGETDAERAEWTRKLKDGAPIVGQRVDIDYSAVNSFNARLRGSARCELIRNRNEPPRYTKMEVTMRD